LRRKAGVDSLTIRDLGRWESNGGKVHPKLLV
jgi:hypothetical protein